VKRGSVFPRLGKIFPPQHCQLPLFGLNGGATGTQRDATMRAEHFKVSLVFRKQVPNLGFWVQELELKPKSSSSRKENYWSYSCSGVRVREAGEISCLFLDEIVTPYGRWLHSFVANLLQVGIWRGSRLETGPDLDQVKYLSQFLPFFAKDKQ